MRDLFVTKKDSIKNYIICILISSVFIFLWIASDANSVFKSDICIKTFDDLSQLYIKGYSIQEHSFYRNDSDAYIILPQNYNADKLKISIDSSSNQDFKIKTFYRTSFGSKTSETILNDGIAIINIRDAIGSIKIQIWGNYEQVIQFNQIMLLKRGYYSFARITILIIFFEILLSSLLYRFINKMKDSGGINIFFNTILITSMLFIVINMMTGSCYFGSYFFGDEKDSFMDFFNMLALLNNPDPYYAYTFYPPLCFVILKLFHMLLPSELQSNDYGVALRDNAIGMLYFIIVIIICTFIIYKVIDCYNKKHLSTKNILLLTISGPFLFCVQRGNILFIAIVFILIYYLYNDSENIYLRCFAYISLIIAANIKMFPALFGLITLKKKNFKGTIFMLFGGIITFIVPFWFFDGLNSIKEFIKALSLGNEIVAEQGLGKFVDLDHLRKLINVIFDLSIPQSQLLIGLIVIILLFLAYITKYEWHAWFLIATAEIWYTTFSAKYTLLLYLPAILSALKSYSPKSEKSTITKFDFVLLGLLMSPIATPYLPDVSSLAGEYIEYFILSVGDILIYAIIIYFVVSIIVETIYRLAENNLNGITNNLSSNKILLQSKKIYVAIISIVTVLGCFSYLYRPYNSGYNFNGRGTQISPYLISTVDDLIYLQELTNNGDDFSGAYFEQTADIEFDGKTSQNPIGWSNKRASFAGLYDGKGYSIKNYYSISHHDEDMGFFGTLSGEVKNLCLENCNIGGSLVGGIAYEVTKTGKIINCSVNGLLWGYHTGGIAAQNSGMIENCLAFVIMDSTKQYGITRDYSDGNVISCYSNINNNISRVSLIDSDTISNLNIYSNAYNKSIFNKQKLSNWKILDGLPKLSTN